MHHHCMAWRAIFRPLSSGTATPPELECHPHHAGKGAEPWAPRSRELLPGWRHCSQVMATSRPESLFHVVLCVLLVQELWLQQCR